MIQLIVWGTASKAKKLLKYLNYEKADVIALTDNSLSYEKIENYIGGYSYIPWDDLLQEKCTYDYIAIASSAFCEITAQLLAYGIEKNKIIQAYNYQFMFPNTLFYFNELETDENKYAVFTNLSAFSFRLMDMGRANEGI